MWVSRSTSTALRWSGPTTSARPESPRRAELGKSYPLAVDPKPDAQGGRAHVGAAARAHGTATLETAFFVDPVQQERRAVGDRAVDRPGRPRPRPLAAPKASVPSVAGATTAVEEFAGNPRLRAPREARAGARRRRRRPEGARQAQAPGAAAVSFFNGPACTWGDMDALGHVDHLPLPPLDGGRAHRLVRRGDARRGSRPAGGRADPGAARRSISPGPVTYRTP